LKRLFVILIPLIPFLVNAQLLNTVEQIGTYNNPYSQLVFVKDSIRGGQFIPYAGTDAQDNGMVFQDALNRKWRRSVNEGERINLAWYGLSSSASIASATNYNAFMAAYNYAANHSWDGGLFIPEGTYRFNQTITIDTSIDIKGIGNFYDWKTILIFPENTKAFRMLTVEGSLANTVVDMSDIEVRGNAEYINPGSLTLDSTKHAFDISCIVHFFEVNVNGYAGDGFHINACAVPAVSNFGNSDNSYFIYCGASLTNNGIYFNGCDANIVTVHNSNFTLNRRYGIRDNGFLGNNYQKNHTAYNGVYKTFCTVLYNGVYYAAINADTLLNVNKQPDINPTYWQVIDFIPYTVNTWNNSTRYWQGGSTLIENPNNYSLVLGDYTEGSQPPIRNRGRALTIGGDNGSGQAEGAWIYADDNRVWVKNSGLVTENLAVTGSFNISGLTGIGVFNGSGAMSTITGTALQVLRRNAANDGFEFAAASGGGISQETLDDSTAALRTTISGKQDAGSYLTTTGNGSGLTGLTKSQVGLANVDNTSDANKPISTATQTALDGKQATLVSNTNIKTVGGQNLLGSGNIVTTNSQTFVSLDDNFSSTSTTPAAVTGWSFAVTNGITYRIQVIGAYQTAATTTGGIIGISLTGATGTVRGSARGAVVSTAAATELVIGIRATSGAGSTLTTTGVTAINSPHAISMDIVFICTGTGTFNIVWGTEVNASAAQINAGSALIYQALN